MAGQNWVKIRRANNKGTVFFSHHRNNKMSKKYSDCGLSAAEM